MLGHAEPRGANRGQRQDFSLAVTDLAADGQRAIEVAEGGRTIAERPEIRERGGEAAPVSDSLESGGGLDPGFVSLLRFAEGTVCVSDVAEAGGFSTPVAHFSAVG
jgi:hypothetical protein